MCRHPGAARRITLRRRPNTYWKSPVAVRVHSVCKLATTYISESYLSRRWTMLDLVIRGGLVVTPEEVGERDIGIQNGTIVAIATPRTLPTEAARVIEAQGHIVLPGGIEPHAHIAIPVPERWAGRPEVMTQPPEAASRAAAFGGVTTVIDFAGNLNPPLDHEVTPPVYPGRNRQPTGCLSRPCLYGFCLPLHSGRPCRPGDPWPDWRSSAGGHCQF